MAAVIGGSGDQDRLPTSFDNVVNVNASLRITKEEYVFHIDTFGDEMTV
jgi:hypothetical protein